MSDKPEAMPETMTDEAIDTALVAAAFELAASVGWIQVSVADAAREAGIPLARARARMPSRQAILRGFGRMADKAALENAPTEGTARDKIFDLLMLRIDVHQAHRAGVLAVLDTLLIDPGTALLLNALTRTSMRWMLDAAGVPRGGALGLISDELRVTGLVAVWLWTIRAWRRDESADLAATMAVLDAALTRAENVGAWLAGRGPATGTPDMATTGMAATGMAATGEETIPNVPAGSEVATIPTPEDSLPELPPTELPPTELPPTSAPPPAH